MTLGSSICQGSLPTTAEKRLIELLRVSARAYAVCNGPQIPMTHDERLVELTLYVQELALCATARIPLNNTGTVRTA